MNAINRTKRTIKSSLLYMIAGAGGMLLLTSCNEDPEYFTLHDYPDQMHIKASTNDIVFNKGLADQTAITFTWDAATSPVSAADEVSYAIRFYETSQKSEHVSDLIELGKVTTKSFTHDELNTIVARWVLPGEPVNVTAQLLCNVHNEQRYVKPIQSLTTFNATCYEKYPTYLYMQMTDALDGSIKTERLEQRQLGTGIYEATVNMKTCTYHFTTTTEPYPAYGQADGEKIAYVTEGSYTEFTSNIIGQRTVIVDTNAPYNDCRVLDILQLPTPGLIWICGNGCSIGWNTNTAAGRLEMVGTLREPYYYAWTGEFTAGGEIKIGLGNGWGDQFFYAPEANTDPVSDHRLLPYRFQDDGGDLKWVPSVSGRYTFTLCLLATDLHTSFEPAN